MQGLLLSIVFNEYLPTPAQILNLSFGFEQMYLLKKAYGEMFFYTSSKASLWVGFF